jgi:hypothetical protein
MAEGYTWVLAMCAVSLAWAGLGIAEALYIIITERRWQTPQTPSKPRRNARPRYRPYSWRAARRS